MWIDAHESSKLATASAAVRTRAAPRSWGASANVPTTPTRLASVARIRITSAATRESSSADAISAVAR